MDGGDNWDLHAVVRACCSTTTTTATTDSAAAATISPFFTDPSIFLPDFDVDDINNKYSSSSDHFNFSLQQQQEQQPFEEKNTTTFDQELHELFRPFFMLSAKYPPPQPPPSQPQQPQPQPQPSPPPPPLSNVLQIAQQKQPLKQQSHPPSHVNIPRSKRRKNQQKKVCQVPAESLSSDIWAWRKYGQKPIKGSPYPRGYYRCSSSKGCLARKQVERSRSDPGIFMVTYTAEHNHPAPTHRNSLAGSTRQKASFTAGQTVSGSGDGSKSQTLNVQINGPSSSSPSLELEDDQVFLPQMMIGTTCAVQCKEEKEDWGEEELGLEDDDEFGISEMVAISGDGNLLVDCFEVDQVLDGTTPSDASADCLTALFPASFGGLFWTVNNAATAAGGI